MPSMARKRYIYLHISVFSIYKDTLRDKGLSHAKKMHG